MKKIALSLAGAMIIGVSMVGCTVNQPPDVVETPGHTTVIHDKTTTPTVNVTTPPATHTETNTTTTTPAPDSSTPGSSTTTQTTTTG